jgi:hypothetical protein
MVRYRQLMGVLPLIFALGCGGADSPRPEAGGLSGRLGAAKEIRDPVERDKAFAQLARDAGDAGDASVVEQALAATRDPDLRDKAAYSAALRLSKGGKTEGATATAKSIRDPVLRDKALAKIAKGDHDE